MTICPKCGHDPAWTKCWECGWSADEDLASTTDATPEARERIPDDRSEAQIQLAIRRTLQAHGFHVYDLSQDRPTRQTPGLADLYVVGHGRCAWIEVKRPKGRQSDAQVLFGRLVAEAGGLYFVWRHEDEAVRWAESAKEGVAS